MNKCVLLIGILPLLLVGFMLGCNSQQTAEVQEVTFEQLFLAPDQYSGKDIVIEGYYYQGWETIVLSEKLIHSGYAPGHLIPEGKMLWIEKGVPKEIYDKLNQQQQMGPLERFGKVKITGKFEYGGKYGHLGGYDQQITPTETIILPWSSPASVTSDREGFAIFLTKEDIPPSRMEALSYIEIADRPVISTEDIIAYDAQNHQIKLTDKAFERISKLEVPVRGKPFLVCVDKVPIYWGAFWTPLSSLSFNGVAIWKPLGSQESKLIILELGYPSSSFYSGEDPRNNIEVMESLDQAGKLINKLSKTSSDKLPYSFKGYELYSWEEDVQWHFTLITGTNRTKTMEEITSKEDLISETGWVKIHVVGADAIKNVIGRLPEGESVFWCDELHIGQLTETYIDLQLPPEPIVDAIKEYAERCELDFAVTEQSYFK